MSTVCLTTPCVSEGSVALIASGWQLSLEIGMTRSEWEEPAFGRVTADFSGKCTVTLPAFPLEHSALLSKSQPLRMNSCPGVTALGQLVITALSINLACRTLEERPVSPEIIVISTVCSSTFPVG